MLRILKWFVILLVFIGAVYVAVNNLTVFNYRLGFVIPVPFGDTWESPQVPLGLALGFAFGIGALVTGLSGAWQILGLRSRLRKARRRVADLEEEVRSYRGLAASESEHDEDEDEEEPAY